MGSNSAYLILATAVRSAVLGATCAGTAAADEIFLKNGDHLTGKIVSADGGKLQLTPDFAKATTITLSQDDIKTFTSSTPITLKLRDGTVVNQPVSSGDDGQVVVAQGGPLVAQNIHIDQIAKINPAVVPPVAWHGSLGVNGLYSDAATTSALIGFTAAATRSTAADTLAVNASYNYGEQTVGGRSTTNANNWTLGGKYSYFILPKVYSYVSIGADADRVNFLTLRFTPSVGAGYRWFDRPDFHFTTDAGLSWIYEDYSSKPDATENAALSVSYHVDKTWDAGRISAFHDLQVLPSLQGSQVLVLTDLGFRTNLTKTMFGEVRLDVAYDSQPAPLAKSTTDQLKIGVGWSY